MLNLVPEFEAGRPPRVLLLGAHSDDIEIGCGGAVLELLKRQPAAEITWVVFSANGVRGEEASASAASFIGKTDTVRLFNFRDGYFPSEHASIKDEFETLKREVNPDLVLTHYRNDLHQDHRVISELTRNTWRDHVILEYEIPKYDGDLDRPNCYVSVSESAAARKIELLLRHFGSQSSKHWFDEATFRALLRLRGLECHSETGLAEAFHARKFTLSW